MAIFEELKKTIDPAIIHLIDKELSPDGRVQKLLGGKVLKFAFDYQPIMDSIDPQIKENRNRALHILNAVSERSPYLTYQVLGGNFKTDRHEGIELHQELSITTLDRLLEKEPLPPLSDCARYITEAMRGAAFLVKHNLRLTDLAPHNIAINQELNTGQLFDYDSLFTDDFVMEGYMTHPGFCPPERIPEKDTEAMNYTDQFEVFLSMMGPMPPQIEGIITEAEMVYEFGATLTKVFQVYTEPVPEIVEKMSSPDPTKRPKLIEVIDTLT